MKNVIVLAVLGLALSACSGKGGSDSSSSSGVGTTDLGVNLVDSTSSSMAMSSKVMSRLQAQSVSPIQGMYFGEMEIVAYNYRPGETVQTNNTFSTNNTDWSHWIVLSSGYDASRNNVLKHSGAIDLAKLRGGYDSTPDYNFVSKAGSFSVDILEVYMYRIGVVQNDNVYAFDQAPAGKSSIVYKYPEFSTFPINDTSSVFPGIDRGMESVDEINVLFVRDDWFSQPVSILMDEHALTPTVQSSSVALNQFQTTIIESMIAQGTNRRFYNNIMVIPFKNFHGPIKTIFPTPENLTKSVLSRGGKTVQVQDPQLWADQIKVNVKFDFNNLLMEDPTVSNKVKFNSDINSVPCGLDVDLMVK
jgi:hypothetical protein